jgi:GNAT superfamily N-acetyltransferase
VQSVLDESIKSANMSGEELASSIPPAYETRYAMREDLAEVLEMYISALKEIQDYIEPISEDRCSKTVFENWLRAPCVLLEKAGQIIGFAGFNSAIPEYSESTILREYMFFIKPEHRSVKAAKTLSDTAKKTADSVGLPLYMSHMVFEHDVNKKANFLKRWGYKVLNIGVKYGK